MVLLINRLDWSYEGSKGIVSLAAHSKILRGCSLAFWIWDVSIVVGTPSKIGPSIEDRIKEPFPVSQVSIGVETVWWLTRLVLSTASILDKIPISFSGTRV